MSEQPTRAIRVVIVEDEPLFGSLLESSLVALSIDVVGRYADAATAIRQAPRAQPDVLLLDLRLGEGMDGIALGNALSAELPHARCVLLTADAGPEVARRLSTQPGDRWSLLRKREVGDIDRVGEVIVAAAAGLTEVVLAESARANVLTATQQRVLELVSAGASNSAIAATIGISVRAVEMHISRGLAALGIDTSDENINPRVMAALRLRDVHDT